MENQGISGRYDLQNAYDLDPLLEKIGDAQHVFLGEASHGTHEYYTWRAQISRRLIQEKGFSFVAVEGDWPDCYKINRWVKGMPDSGESIHDVLKEFERWPTWMWANWEVAAFAQWMKNHNQNLDSQNKIGFYGLDVYSLWQSLETIVGYLKKEDPKTAELAKEVAECFEPYKRNDSYATAYRDLRETCRDEVIELLAEIRRNFAQYKDEPEAGLNAEINSVVLKNAEKYYEAMTAFDNSSWNVRDSHMMETLTILKNSKPQAKTIVWAHNTHVGDARATDMARSGMHNIGQLARQEFGKENVKLVGFGSYRGSVVAGDFWGANMRKMVLPPAINGSLEYSLHKKYAKNKLFVFDPVYPMQEFEDRMGHRAVGVVYHPDKERGNYVPTKLEERYDAFMYIDQTQALHPLPLKTKESQVPETYPFGL